MDQRLGFVEINGSWVGGWHLLEDVCLIKKRRMTDFERELWREDSMALDAIRHDFWK